MGSLNDVKSTKAMNLKFGRSKSGKKILCNLQASINFKKKSGEIKHHLSNIVSNVYLNFILCREISKRYVVTNRILGKSQTSDLRMTHECI